MENIDDLIDDLIEERKEDRLRAYVYRCFKEDGLTINEYQSEYLNHVINNDRVVTIKGRELGISTINEYIGDFYNWEIPVYANIHHTHRYGDTYEYAKVFIFDGISGNLKLHDNVIYGNGYRPEKVIVSAVADYNGSYLHQLYESDLYNSFRIRNTDEEINTLDVGFLGRERIEREYYCHFN